MGGCIVRHVKCIYGVEKKGFASHKHLHCRTASAYLAREW